jgi:LysR family glycine cleavage system transcriptional activator
MSTLPPLTAVRAFEAVARHLSFTKAGDELGMTQAAVSYQIRILEERVGAPLFLRKPRQIQLTDIGARLAPNISRAFDIMRTSFADLDVDTHNMLSLTVVHTFASRWLAANVGLFQLAHPNVAVRIDTDSNLVDFSRSNVDAAVRATHTLAPGLMGHKLLKVEFTPMLHPSLIEQYDVREPADLLRVPQLTPEDPWLAGWLKLAGVDVPELPKSFVSLGTQYLEAAAVMAGRGMAMMTPPFYADDIAAGRLVQPFSTVGWEGHYYYFCYPETRRNSPKIKAFRDWIVPATEPLRALEQT